MSEQIAAVEPLPAPEPMPESDAPLSVMEHAAEFGPNRGRAPEPPSELPANATPEQKAAHHSEQQRREKETGKFTEGRRRHRAASQQATAADAPRIQELTRKNKELQAQIDAAAARQAAPAPPQASPRQELAPPQAPAPIAAQAPPQARVTDPSDPEPQETDPKFGGDPLKFIQAHNRWSARDEYRQVRAAEQRQQYESQINQTFAMRADAVAQKYQDFATAVGALDASKRIPVGSVIDQFILTDDNGAEVLYHLASHSQELDALLRVPVFQQMRHLTLLSQRYHPASASPPSAQAGKTGSVARQQVRFLPPKPPNPVRTEAQRASGGPPPTDGSLSVMSHAKQFRRS